MWSLSHDWLPPHGVRTHLRRLAVGTWVMAIAGWVTVLTGAYLVFPLYRASPPPASANLNAYPKAFILAHPDLTVLQTIGMSWKEHIAWFAPILATAVGVVALGVIDVLAKTVAPFDALLSWYPPIGDLSGITSLSVVVWLVVWAGLSRAWGARSVDSGRVLAATLILTAIGVILTFPPSAQLVPW